MTVRQMVAQIGREHECMDMRGVVRSVKGPRFAKSVTFATASSSRASSAR
jgi:hypothetical protein